MDLRTLNRFFLSALPILCITLFFIEKSPNWIGSPDPEVLRIPIQTEIQSPQPIERRVGGLDYKIEPLYDYDIAGLVVARWGGLFNVGEETFLNVGLMWGDSVASEIYKKFNFRIDFYVLYTNSKSGDPADYKELKKDELSHNHLLVLDQDIVRKIKKISIWDQVRIKGKLAKVRIYDASGQLIGGKDTSVTRDDGVCETIYVEDMQFLKKGHAFFRVVHAIAFYGWLILLAANIGYWLKYPERF